MKYIIIILLLAGCKKQMEVPETPMNTEGWILIKCEFSSHCSYRLIRDSVPRERDTSIYNPLKPLSK